MAASLIAFIGVALTLGLTLAWNRRKHNEDRNLSLKKDCFVSYIQAIAAQSSQWFVLAEPEVDYGTARVNAAQVSVRLMANAQSREAADAVSKAANIITNLSRDARKELATRKKKLDSLPFGQLSAEGVFLVRQEQLLQRFPDVPATSPHFLTMPSRSLGWNLG